MIKLDQNGNLIVDGKKVKRKDPLSYFTKDAPIMHGRFGSVTRTSDPVVQANVLEDEEHAVEDDVDPEFKAEIEDLLRFDRH